MSTPPTFWRLLDRQLETLLGSLPAARTGDVSAVHQARVASRRLRAMLPIVAAGAPRDALRRARRDVRRITRALGPVREVDVALGHVDEVAARDLAPVAAIAKVRRALQRQRDALRSEMRGAITAVRIEKLRTHVAALRTGAPRAAIGLAQARAEAERRVGRGGRRMMAAMDHAGGLYLPDRLHQVRVAAKKLRYVLEMRRQLVRSRAAAQISQLRTLQDLLGRMHDLEVLVDRVRVVQAEMAVGARTLGTRLDEVVRAFEAECRELHGRYVSQRVAWRRLASHLASSPGG